MTPKHHLFAALLVACPVTSASGQWWWPPDCAAAPSQATCLDEISVTLSGMWPDSCVPQDIEARVVGTDVIVDLYLPPSDGCLTVISPWALTAAVGHLPHGTYPVIVSVLQRGKFGDILVSGPTTSCSFAVEPHPADFAAPLGQLDVFDVLAFLDLFDDMDSAADLAAPFGVWDFFDVLAFLALFEQGCP